ncbi:MAG TPA: hypothetical protein VMH20_19395 [Verrucomicrobiae bacterium]|nr:hypothetical protein [Verrucomicrobiae bacterium]
MGIKDCVVTPIAVDASRGQKAPSRQNRFSLSRQLFFAVVLLFGFAVPRRAALGQEKPGDAAEETTIVKQRAWLEGNFVRLRLLEDVSSASARVGDPVRFELVDGVNLCGKPIIAGGHVTEVQPKRRLGRAGSLQITLDYLEVSGRDKIPLRGNTDVKGKNQKKGMMVAIILAPVPLVFPFPAPATVFARGEDAVLHAGTEITVEVSGDVRVALESVTSDP